MPKPRLKKAATAVPVPQTRDAVTAAIREIGDRQRELARIAADMNDELAAVRERYERQAEPLNARVAELQAGVQTWCEANRDQLTNHGKVKSASFPSGDVQWRLRPPSVAVRGVEAVLDQLRRLGLKRFIRTKDEVNKEAVLADPAAVAQVAGLTINQGEDFVISPFETELASEAA